MIINKVHLCTRMQVWTPKYSTKFGDYGEPVALLHKSKVDHASPIIIIEFTKAKHLIGQRFAIRREEAQQHDIGTNGTADMYIVPMSHLERYDTAEEIKQVINELWPN